MCRTTKGNMMQLKIRDIREDKDLTQKQVAEYLMCDQSLYSKYERGEREMSLCMAVRLAVYYGVSVDYLVGLTNQKNRICAEKRRYGFLVRLD